MEFDKLIISKIHKKIIYFYKNISFINLEIYIGIITCIIIYYSKKASKMQKEYICGCGKAYGSYPAYSTHKKFKHSNETIQGTIMPPQEKAKRGRPSYDFKKIPKIGQTSQRYYQGLNIIENTLLQLELEYKGKILSDPYDSFCDDDLMSDFSDLSSQDQSQSQRVQAIIQFVKLVTSHTTTETSKIIIKFMHHFIEQGLNAGEILNIQVFNKYFKAHYSSLKNSDMGLEFYLTLCIMLTRWLFAVGKAKQTLRIPQKIKEYFKSHKNIGKNQPIHNETVGTA